MEGARVWDHKALFPFGPAATIKAFDEPAGHACKPKLPAQIRLRVLKMATLIDNRNPVWSTFMWIGYARTSTADCFADLEVQEHVLKAAGCEKVFSERISSISARLQLGAVLELIRNGDVLVVTKPDRVARSTAELLSILDGITTKGVAMIILSIGAKRLDTRDPKSELTLATLAGVVTWERDIEFERQRESLAKSTARKRNTGRPPKVLRQADDIWRLWNDGLSAPNIARHLGISYSSVYRVLPKTFSGIADVDGTDTG